MSIDAFGKMYVKNKLSKIYCYDFKASSNIMSTFLLLGYIKTGADTAFQRG